MSFNKQCGGLHTLGYKKYTGLLSFLSIFHKAIIKDFTLPKNKKDIVAFEFCPDCGENLLPYPNKEKSAISKFNTNEKFRNFVLDQEISYNAAMIKDRLAETITLLSKQLVQLKIDPQYPKKMMVAIDISASIELEILEAIGDVLTSYNNIDLFFFHTEVAKSYKNIQGSEINNKIDDVIKNHFSLGGTDLGWLKDHIDHYEQVLIFSDGYLPPIDFKDKTKIIYLYQDAYDSFIKEQ